MHSACLETVVTRAVCQAVVVEAAENKDDDYFDADVLAILGLLTETGPRPPEKKTTVHVPVVQPPAPPTLQTQPFTQYTAEGLFRALHDEIHNKSPTCA